MSILSRLRRTASYSNIQIKEATNEEEDDENETEEQKITSKRQKLLQLKAIKQHERFSQAHIGVSLMNQSTQDARSYFKQGSTRNTAHDEEFFHCFV